MSVEPSAEISARLSDILARQRAAFMRDGPPALDVRRNDLLRLKVALQQRRRDIEKAISADFSHRSTYETAIFELNPLVNAIGYLRRNLARWMRPERRRVALHYWLGRNRIVYQPLGVVGVIAPWNFPLSLALTPLATAIAAGNRVMLKPSEFAPQTSALMSDMLEALFPAEQVAVVTGAADVAAAFSSLPFDHLIFTGSTPVGKTVMKAASANLTPVTLELGGKSPVVVAKDAELSRAAASVAFGKLSNAGQICISPDYALVHADAVDDFVGAYDAAVRASFPEGPTSQNYSSIIDDRHFARLNALLDDARSKGAQVKAVGVNPESASQRARTLAPTIVLGATNQMGVMREEIFGPILPILTYREIDDAIARINAVPRPLALYYFGSDDEGRRKLLARTTSGGVAINETLLHYAQDSLPFGGVGASGMGAYHGIEGFKALSHARSVFEQSRWNLAWSTRPPYGKLSEWVIKYLLW